VRRCRWNQEYSRREERGRILIETVPDGGARSTTCTCKKRKDGSRERATGKRKSTKATHDPSKKAKKTL
jgi:hypothetical protein